MPLDLALFRDKVLGSIELRAGLFSYKYLEGRLEARRDHNTALSGHQGSEAARVAATLLKTSLIDEGLFCNHDRGSPNVWSRVYFRTSNSLSDTWILKGFPKISHMGPLRFPIIKFFLKNLARIRALRI